MNLPEYRRALNEAHERFRNHTGKAAQAYGQEVERAAAELQEAMAAISHEFHEDPQEARAARPVDTYPGEAEMATRARTRL